MPRPWWSGSVAVSTARAARTAPPSALELPAHERAEARRRVAVDARPTSATRRRVLEVLPLEELASRRSTAAPARPARAHRGNRRRRPSDLQVVSRAIGLILRPRPRPSDPTRSASRPGRGTATPAPPRGPRARRPPTATDPSSGATTATQDSGDQQRPRHRPARRHGANRHWRTAKSGGDRDLGAPTPAADRASGRASRTFSATMPSTHIATIAQRGTTTSVRPPPVR